MKKEAVNFEVRLSIPRERVMNILCCGFEGGIGYWWTDYGFDYALVGSGVAEDELWLGVEDDIWTPVYLIPTARGGKLEITSLEHVEGRKEWELSIETLTAGLHVLREENPRQFSRIVRNDIDADSGDLLIQCALFGKQVFG